MTRYAMVIDQKKCIGCHACSMSCKAENGTPPGVFWSKVKVQEEGTFPNTRLRFTPLLCMNCKNPPCVDVCPTGASHKLENGIVAVDYDKCMGCRYCETACPYGARTFVSEIRPYYADVGFNPYEQFMYQKHQAGVVEKCNFCMDRVASGKEPACVTTCPAGARTFGDLDNPNSEVSRLIAARDGHTLHPELGTEPSVFYLSA